ncbi:DNA mismatch repair protein MutS [Terasakiella sp. SH-1]|uniref:DNA mismatch repair protein MutS n=1 Tax=Terasakiella sp. SH-1 TaxID=2560057 RepID=UPI0010732855|nr:DNA mismatch repair protein MutS [Terasakiella sp. SH-1]
MMAQFMAIKDRHPGYLLFYRMGDFYELFFEDAVAAANALQITLTKRGHHKGDDIPMCGVPVKAYESYLPKLVDKGFKVALCEQMEDPAEAKKRGSKAVVKRDVVRLFTAGTITEDTLLDSRQNNYLAAVTQTRNDIGVAWLDISTGAFYTQACSPAVLPAVLARLNPGELLISDKLLQTPDHFETFNDFKSILTPQPGTRFDSANATKRLEKLYGVKTLESFASFSRVEISAAGALVDYVELTQKGKLPRLEVPRQMAQGASMEIDAATRRNLELTITLSGQRKGSLLEVIDRTVSGAGARLLAGWLSSPLTNVDDIDTRLDGVQFFAEDLAAREDIRAALKKCPDMERALSRITLGRGGPRDLAGIRDGLTASFELREKLLPLTPPPILEQCATDLGNHGELVDKLRRALSEDLPLLARDGDFIATGYAPELDELRSLRSESKRLISNLQARYAEMVDIPTLKVKHNNVLGYFVEVTAKQSEKMPTDGVFIHRQTMKNVIRYTTVELSELEGKISSAGDRALALETRLFEELIGDVMARADEIARAANALARLDVLAALAQIAVERDFNRPVLSGGYEFDIKGGRHPVVEAALIAANESAFVANDCDLSEQQRLWLITGPNMAGKSTFLRQNALITIMAQMGGFVPADQAHIGVVDRLFSRVGAADDLARGRSTFMVEMVEAAAILNQSSDRSLVILDEIGRGTATFDGLSIAWAVVEHLHELNKCRSLFATHYHELTALTSKLSHLSCHSMRVKEWKGEVIFLHEVGAGAADRSYGIHVARLAGLPKAVIKRAEQVLETLEQGEQSSAVTKLADDLPLFAALANEPDPIVVESGPSEVETALDDIQPDDMSPREALEALYKLKDLRGA